MIIKRYCKWIILILVLILVVINYYALCEIFEKTAIIPLNEYLNSLGYRLSITESFHFIFKIMPSLSVIGYVLNINNENVKNKVKNLYGTINIKQLALALVGLSSLLYFQNKFYDHFLSFTKTKDKK